MATRLDLEGCCFEVHCSNKGVRRVLGEIGICFPTSHFDEGAPCPIVLLVCGDIFWHGGESSGDFDSFFEISFEGVVF